MNTPVRYIPQLVNIYKLLDLMSLGNHSIFCPVYISQSVDSLNTHHAFEILLVPCFKMLVIYTLKMFFSENYIYLIA